MKKILSVILAVALCLSLGAAAFASGEASGGASGGRALPTGKPWFSYPRGYDPLTPGGMVFLSRGGGRASPAEGGPGAVPADTEGGPPGGARDTRPPPVSGYLYPRGPDTYIPECLIPISPVFLSRRG